MSKSQKLNIKCFYIISNKMKYVRTYVLLNITNALLYLLLKK